MKHTVLTLVAVLVVALLAIGGWYLAESSRLESESEDFAEQAAAREMIEVAFVVDVPDSTPEDQIVYISGSHPNLGAWQAAGLPLQRGDDGKYHGRAELLSGIEHEFKITRGTWGTVERTADDQDLDNRPFVAKKDATVTAEVARWVDKGLSTPGRQTLTGDVRIIAKVPSKHLELPRDVVVYLPPNYDAPDAAETRYPVLYLNDGQNLFNEATSFAGVEWRLDEALQQLIANGEVPAMIVVGIYNTDNRDAEYTPAVRTESIPADADAAASPASFAGYATFVTNELKPMIDKRYRTLPGREHTAVGGSSLGGLTGLALAMQSPEAFGRVVALSPHLRVADRPLAEALDAELLAALSDTRVYLDMGDAATDNYPQPEQAVADAEAFAAALDSAGVEHTFNIVPGGTHHEPDWSARIVDVLKQVYSE